MHVGVMKSPRSTKEGRIQYLCTIPPSCANHALWCLLCRCTSRFMINSKCCSYDLMLVVGLVIQYVSAQCSIGLQLTQRVCYPRAGVTHASLTDSHYPQMYEYCDRCYNSDQSALHRVSTHCQSTTTLQPEC